MKQGGFIQLNLTVVWSEEKFTENYKSNKTANIPYSCSKCDIELTSSLAALTRKTSNGLCVKCFAKKRSSSYIGVMGIFKDVNASLLWDEHQFEENYINSGQANIPYICECGEESLASVDNIKQGHKCKACAKDRMKVTCMSKYGVSHPMKAKEFMAKSKATCLANFGVEYPMQSLDVKEKSKATCQSSFGVDYPMMSDEVRDKSKKACLSKWGVEHSSQSAEVKQKVRDTNLSKWGTICPLQAPEVIEKSKKTCMEKWGVENPSQAPEVRNRFRETCVAKWGVEYPAQAPEVKQKVKETCMAKWGVENPMHNPEIAAKAIKNAYKNKTYTLPSGETLEYQGYEHFALDELLYTENIAENDIVTDRSMVPAIWYTRDGKLRRYYTDIYIPSLNLCIEVKSDYTATYDVDIIEMKKQAVLDAGYKYELRVYDRHGNRV